MATIWTGNFVYLEDTITSNGQDYKLINKASGHMKWKADNEFYPIIETHYSTHNPYSLTLPNRAAFYTDDGKIKGDVRLDFEDNKYAIFYAYIKYQNTSYVTPTYYDTAQLDGDSATNYSVLRTNIPVFSTYSEAQTYIRTGEGIENAINFKNTPAFQDTRDYYINNNFQDGKVTLGQMEYLGTNRRSRNLLFKANSEPVLYYKNYGNSLELELLATEIVGSTYSSVWSEAQNTPIDEWTEGSLEYSGPFYALYDFLPNGTYTTGTLLNTNVYIAKNKTDAERFLRGEIPAEDMLNYGDIAGGRTVNEAKNLTGTAELTTEFGGNQSENVFSHDYMVSRSELAAIGGKFFDTNIVSALLDGLKLYGNANPMESVLGCLYFPFDLTSVCPDYTSVTDIYFGSYKMENVSAKKITHRSGYIDMGSTFIKPTFYNWLDYKAMHIYLYLAYIGFVELDINKYMNKWLKIIYMIDIHSGECEVSLLADGLMMDTYSGQIGIKQPITYNDLASYYQSQITSLRNGVMSAVGGPIAGAGTGAQIGSNGGPYGMLAGALAGASVGQMVGGANAMWQGWKVAHTKPPLFSKGGYSSEIGANMPQYCFLVFMYNDVEVPANELELYGKPSNRSGKVGSFSGFLSTNYVKLQCATATDEEKAEIVSLLNSGIYI